jgi:hypothetical protein
LIMNVAGPIGERLLLLVSISETAGTTVDAR